MGTKLEEAFNLRPLAEAQDDVDEKDVEKEAAKNAITPEEALERSAQIVSALSAAEKIDHALTVVAGLNEHDTEMDEIAKEALESYIQLKELGMNMPDAHSGRMMEVAASMLNVALNARDAKVNRKLKTIELQLKKMRLDKEAGSEDQAGPEGTVFDRNQLLKSLKELRSKE